MTKKKSVPTKTATAAKAAPAKSKSGKVVAKAAKPAAPAKAKAAAKPAAAKKPAATPSKAAAKSPAKVALKAAAKAAPQASNAKAAAKSLPAKAAVPSAKTPARPAAPRAPTAPAQRAMPAAGKDASARLTAAPSGKPAQTPAAAASAEPRKPVTARHGFKTNELIVYPAHGVGKIIGIEEQEIAGISLELFVIEFEKDKMTLRVPTAKLASVGMRKLAEDGIVTKALDTLKGRARIKRTMWSRRAQEYEAKINSGDLVAIAEVVRDLYRSEAQPEQSYSERQLYEAALDRMARELAAVDRSDERSAMQRITEILAKSARGRRVAEEAQNGDSEESSGEVKAA